MINDGLVSSFFQGTPFDILGEIEDQIKQVIDEEQEQDEEIERKGIAILESLGEKAEEDSKKKSVFTWIKKLKTTTKISKQKIYLLMLQNLFGRKNTQKTKGPNETPTLRKTMGMSVKRNSVRMRLSSFNRMTSKAKVNTLVQKSIDIISKGEVIIHLRKLNSIHRIKHLMNFDKVPVNCLPAPATIFRINTKNLIDEGFEDEENLKLIQIGKVNDPKHSFKNLNKLQYKVDLLPILIKKNCSKQVSIKDNDNVDKMLNSDVFEELEIKEEEKDEEENNGIIRILYKHNPDNIKDFNEIKKLIEK